MCRCENVADLKEIQEGKECSLEGNSITKFCDKSRIFRLIFKSMITSFKRINHDYYYSLINTALVPKYFCLFS